jgi:hypothetical protein
MNVRRLTTSILAAFGVLALGAGPALAAREHHPGIPPSFGGPGADPGHFNAPSGVALNDSTALEPAAGDVYVIDRGDNRVERFGPEGEYEGQFNGSAEFEVGAKKEKGSPAPTGTFAFGEENSLDNGIAVDDSGKSKLEDPSVGDVYVVDSGHAVIDEFEALGGYDAQLTGICKQAGFCPGAAIPFSKVYGVAVDPAGNLWVSYQSAESGESVDIAEFTDAGAFVKSLDTGERGGFYNALAVDSSDVYYAGARRAIDKFDTHTGSKMAEFDRAEAAYGVASLAVDPSTGDLFVVDYSSSYSEEDSDVEVYGPAGEPYSAPLEEFPFATQGELEEHVRHHLMPQYQFSGIAVGPNGTVYASLRNASAVAIYEDVSLPEVLTATATEAGPTEDRVALRGSFNPEGRQVTACQFEYVSEEAFRQAKAVEAEASGLAGEASRSATEARGRAAAAKARAEQLEAEGRKEKAAEEEELAKAEAERATAEETRAQAEEARAQEQQGGWGTAADAACEPPPAAITGDSAVVIQAKASGLQASTAYRIRLVVIAGGKPRSSSEFAFFAATRPRVEAETVNAGSTEAKVSAKIDPSGLPTSYRVEYGIADVEEHSTAEASAGTATAPVRVSVLLGKLQAGAGYRFRFVASNSLGVATGQTVTFATTAASVAGGGSESNCPNRTFSGFSAALPDCRAYELVSAAEDDTYLPDYDDASYIETGEIVGLEGSYRAAPSGDGVAYMAGPSASGVGGNGKTGNGNGNHYLATRGAKGWEASNIELPFNSAYNVNFEDFSADLSVETIATASPEARAEPEEPADCASAETTELYSRTASGLHALVTTNQGSAICDAESAGISADDSHILLQSSGAYTAQAKAGSLFADENLYDSVDGALHQVNVLPDGEPEQQPDATFGTRVPGEFGENQTYDDFSGDVSADGSRVFWTALEGSTEEPRPKALYVRENDSQPQSPVVGGKCTVSADACTLQLDAAEPGAGPSGGGQFWTASGDGSRVFFTDQSQLTKSSTAAPGEPDLYEYEVSGEAGAPGALVDLTVDGHAGEHANVQGVIGASEDGSYVYFVADGVLAAGNAEGNVPIPGQPNLYLAHGGATTFVATLEAEDDVIHSKGGGQREVGDWQAQQGARTAEVTPGGLAVGFMSRRSLTGYDNRRIKSYGFNNEPEYEALPEVFLYEAGTGRVVCASCSPTGAAAVAEGYVSTSGNASFMSHWLSEREGTEVYFMTSQPLVADDSNGLQDVYEWESEGSGACQQVSGCVALLSPADPQSSAYFVDASTSGNDVFITSRAQLVPSATDETLKLYDVRADGGRSETSLACTGTGCQGVPPAPPIFATPASVTFGGVGNFAPPPPSAVKPKAKAKSRKCGRGRVKQHGRCVKPSKKRRKRQARKTSATRKGR